MNRNVFSILVLVISFAFINNCNPGPNHDFAGLTRMPTGSFQWLWKVWRPLNCYVASSKQIKSVSSVCSTRRRAEKKTSLKNSHGNKNQTKILFCPKHPAPFWMGGIAAQTCVNHRKASFLPMSLRRRLIGGFLQPWPIFWNPLPSVHGSPLCGVPRNFRKCV